MIATAATPYRIRLTGPNATFAAALPPRLGGITFYGPKND
jgi:hypothetical protein